MRKCFSPKDQRHIEFREMLDEAGISYDEIITHNYRKGSVSAAASGSTCASPIVVICLLAGWKLSGVLDTYPVYLSMENAGR